MNEQLTEIVFGIICNAGEAKSLAFEAISCAKTENDILKAKDKILEARAILTEAHVHQTSLIQMEAGGEKVDVGVLLIHSQDHLMTTITFIEMAEEIIDLYSKLK